MGQQVASLSEAYKMRSEIRAWHGYYRCLGRDSRLSFARRYEANIMAEAANESLGDCEELIARLRRGR